MRYAVLLAFALAACGGNLPCAQEAANMVDAYTVLDHADAGMKAGFEIDRLLDPRSNLEKAQDMFDGKGPDIAAEVAKEMSSPDTEYGLASAHRQEAKERFYDCRRAELERNREP